MHFGGCNFDGASISYDENTRPNYGCFEIINNYKNAFHILDVQLWLFPVKVYVEKTQATFRDVRQVFDTTNCTARFVAIEAGRFGIQVGVYTNEALDGLSITIVRQSCKRTRRRIYDSCALDYSLKPNCLKNRCPLPQRLQLSCRRLRFRSAIRRESTFYRLPLPIQLQRRATAKNLRRTF